MNIALPPKFKVVPNLYRVLSDDSGMINNDEFVEYTTVKPSSPPSARYKWRPVYEIEVTQGLDTSYRGSAYDETRIQITHALDGFHDIVNKIEQSVAVFKPGYNNPTNILAHIIAYEYYDCMSGGMNKYSVLVARALIKQHNCDLNHNVYAGSSLGDFMKETDNQALENKSRDAIITNLLEGSI